MAKRNTGSRSFEGFRVDAELTKPARIAAFLAWWAQQRPYDFAAYNEILKAIMGYAKLPRMDTKDVEAVRDCTGRSEKILHEQFKRALIRHRGLGARASVDDADVIRHKQVDRARQVERSVMRFVRQGEIVDVRRVPDSPENRVLKQWYQRDASNIIKMVSAPEFLAKLLPPASRDDKKK